jgi:hypothetical protein
MQWDMYFHGTHWCRCISCRLIVLGQVIFVHWYLELLANFPTMFCTLFYIASCHSSFAYLGCRCPTWHYLCDCFSSYESYMCYGQSQHYRQFIDCRIWDLNGKPREILTILGEPRCRARLMLPFWRCLSHSHAHRSIQKPERAVLGHCQHDLLDVRSMPVY